MTTASESEGVLLSVRQLCKYFPIQSTAFFRRQVGVVKACHEVSFDFPCPQVAYA